MPTWLTGTSKPTGHWAPARDRHRKLIAKIDAALARIEDAYGCAGDRRAIGLRRLDARPIATLTLKSGGTSG